ncbi:MULTISPECIES: SDR family NAD(P)-dependent oxidoreductase [Kytococcus]|uniref:SDR family NAD(P)-dependent oxidoreductase n=1 Tax=Kytococcus TaxID=57499 RepID=UPI0008A1001F|nr:MULTISPECIES: SDR family NAD(P)-dependent oxidoreductase [Kytococcus]OFS13226.1 short-chain dehydrogenase [Kytococcus sp. HMSC28H12]
MQLEGKVFAVTGGGDGIGREVVLGLLRAGARVAAVDRSAEGLAATRAEAVNEGAGEFLSTHAVDVTDRAAVEALPEAVVAEHGAVDGLLNVAGVIQPFVTVGELAVEDVRRVVDVNFWGVVNTCQAFLPHLQARPEAAVLNVSSMGALTPVPGQAAYGASKAAVKLFTEALYCELKDGPVAVTVAFPGAVETGIADNSGVSVGAAADDPAAAEASSFPRTSAPDAAEVILRALEEGAFRVVIGKDARFVDRASRIAPRWAADLITRRMQSLLERR